MEALLEKARSKQLKTCIFGAGYIGKYLGRELLEIYDITPDFYCDNNCQLWGKEIIAGIVCKPLDELIQDADSVLCFIALGMRNMDEVVEQLQGLGITNIITSVQLVHLQTTKEYYFPFMKEKKIAIYTCIVGEYDHLLEPQYISEECDYYLISDRKPQKKTIYQYRDINNYLPQIELDNTRKNRFIKFHPHLIFPDYKYSVYIDGNVVLKDDIAECINKMGRCRIMPVRKYPYDSYAEAIQMMNNGVGEPDIIYKQMKQYYLEGMPLNFGHWMNGILIREHNNAQCIEIMNDWWKEVLTKSRRDQLSLPYVLWKKGFEPSDISVISESVNTSFDKECKYFDAILEHAVERKKDQFMRK